MTNPYQQPAPNPAWAKADAQRGMTDQERAADNVRRGADALDEDAQRTGLPAGVAERKRAAANDLRTYADQVASGDRKYCAEEAEAMATAGNCSGILIDGGPGFNENDSWYSEETKREFREQADRKRAVLDNLVADGRMVRVADDGQVPFYALASYGGWSRDEVADRSDVDEA